MFSEQIELRTTESRQVIVVTGQVRDLAGQSAVRDGLCLVSTPHTSCAVTINENADPDVQSDLLRAFAALVPNVRFDHAEGNSDAHLLASLIGSSVTIPLIDGRLQLGRWQGVWLVELDGPRARSLRVSVLGA